MDDILVHKVADDHYFLCVNASNQEKDYRAHPRRQPLRAHEWSSPATATRSSPSRARARSTLQKLTPSIWPPFAITGSPTARLRHSARIARTGYTGEDGFEIYVAPDEAPRVWNEILDAGQEFGIKPCGLGARNTLRLEAKMALYGHEIHASITPCEADLGWIVKLDKGDFVGRAALARQKGTRRAAS